MKTTVYKQIDADSNVWECQFCKEAWQLTEGTPSDNRMNFCPRCGAKVGSELYAD